ncbi:hypothetical protein PP178_13105 [Zeaxanthinibacter sp. PT1]|uniref:hypothetical protein n=1 Tax=Zeaxanthinibacter TaxID=561554 RepID=UPI00234BBBA9|nr:hypothetical protein [Zeaxanthinibacter sp. PT1]MDC6352492.1 hypothetical protein [Zeaxanthinibacter sp. PT1]
MMKKVYLFVVSCCTAMLLPVTQLHAQDENQERPAYITVTTLHWNMDKEDFDMDKWKAMEKEYLDKVTSKNEHVMGSGYYLHRFTPDNRELVAVTTYPSWEAIDKAAARDGELIKEGWPDEEARKAYFKERNSYYADFHSDEIYAPMENVKPLTADGEKIVLVRRSQLKFPGDGSYDEFNKAHMDYVDNVFRKNDHIKGYYPLMHAWGADRREMVEAFYVDSMDELDKMYDKNNELFMAKWDTEEAREEMQAMASKYFTGIHGDYIYTMVPELRK